MLEDRTSSLLQQLKKIAAVFIISQQVHVVDDHD